MEKSEIKNVIEALKLSVTFQFIPFSQSRNKAEKMPSLNYKATVLCNGKELFTTDYMSGCAHCPSYKQGKLSIGENNAIKQECETGFKIMKGFDSTSYLSENKIIPGIVDFFYCISSDCDVLNYSSFEDWAENFEYETDSRSAEKIYDVCLKQALAMRNAIGETGLTQLQEAFQDY